MYDLNYDTTLDLIQSGALDRAAQARRALREPSRRDAPLHTESNTASPKR